MASDGVFFCFGRSDIEQTLELDYQGSIEQFSQLKEQEPRALP
ncbi:hypothetical protein [Thermostichus vulcanus]|nr:hypothetical protein [Thermostichus vulcanus]